MTPTVIYRPGAFPKHCACGRTYSKKDWEAAPHCGVFEGTDGNGERITDDLELRNCVCRSTLAVPIMAATDRQQTGEAA